MTPLIRRITRFLLATEYAWHKVDEYLARQRGDYKSASWSLNRALAIEDTYRRI